MPRMTADERRESVLAVALPAFAAGGLAGTSTEEIARRAGVSQPYLFRLYPTKKALFLASVERAFARVGATFTAAAEGRHGVDALIAMGTAYADLLADRDLLRHQLQAYAASDDPEVGEVTRREFGRLWTIVERASGASPEQLQQWFAMGMLMNVAAALDLPHHPTTWAASCTAGFAPPPPATD